jgi:adhesin transport system membrane fusion protein
MSKSTLPAQVRQGDLQLLNDLNAALQQERHWGLLTMVALISALVIVFLIWATFSNVEEVTRGQGKVISSSREQVIQSLDPGVISEMLVKEGDIVEKDQVIIRLDSNRSGALYREVEAKKLSLAAAAARLRAEAFGTKIKFDPEVPEDMRQREQEAFEAQTRMLNEGVAGMEQSKKLLDREIAITSPMVTDGVMSEVELLHMQRQSADLNLQIQERVAKFRTDANSDLSKVEAELAQATENAAARDDALIRTEIRAPLRGVVKNVRINTVGGVVSPGQDILEIAPLDETLLVEAYISPKDVAFIHPGQDALIKLSAYDFSLYGGLEGKVEFLSPDTLRDERRQGPTPGMAPEEAFYRVLVRTGKTSLTDRKGKPLPIIPGMVASVDIKTGRKTVMQYLIKPITRLKQAMQER